MGRLKWPTDKVPLLNCNDGGENHAFFAEDFDLKEEPTDDKDSSEDGKKSEGYGWILASFYIVADIAGW